MQSTEWTHDKYLLEEWRDKWMDLRLSNWGLERMSDWIIERELSPEDDIGIPGSTILSAEVPRKVFQNIDATAQARHNASESLSQDVRVSKAPQTNSVRSERWNPLLIVPHHPTPHHTHTRVQKHCFWLHRHNVFCQYSWKSRLLFRKKSIGGMDCCDNKCCRIKGRLKPCISGGAASDHSPFAAEPGILWKRGNMPGYSRVADQDTSRQI